MSRYMCQLCRASGSELTCHRCSTRWTVNGSLAQSMQEHARLLAFTAKVHRHAEVPQVLTALGHCCQGVWEHTLLKLCRFWERSKSIIQRKCAQLCPIWLSFVHRLWLFLEHRLIWVILSYTVIQLLTSLFCLVLSMAGCTLWAAWDVSAPGGADSQAFSVPANNICRKEINVLILTNVEHKVDGFLGGSNLLFLIGFFNLRSGRGLILLLLLLLLHFHGRSVAVLRRFLHTCQDQYAPRGSAHRKGNEQIDALVLDQTDPPRCRQCRDDFQRS